jgi:hypothetical protein
MFKIFGPKNLTKIGASLVIVFLAQAAHGECDSLQVEVHYKCVMTGAGENPVLWDETANGGSNCVDLNGQTQYTTFVTKTYAIVNTDVETNLKTVSYGSKVASLRSRVFFSRSPEGLPVAMIRVAREGAASDKYTYSRTPVSVSYHATLAVGITAPGTKACGLQCGTDPTLKAMDTQDEYGKTSGHLQSASKDSPVQVACDYRIGK